MTTQHRLADGTPVTLGMRVRDYDRKYGVIVDDSDREYAPNVEQLERAHQTLCRDSAQPFPIPITPDMDGRYTCDAWFDVLRDDGTRSSMDCSRMIAEGGRLDR